MASNILFKLRESDYEKLSDDDLQKISSGKYKNDEELLSNLSDQALMVIAGDKSPVPNLSKEPPKTSMSDAALIGLQKGATLGFRPAIGGLGAGLGAIVGTSGGLKEKLAAFSPAYQEARGELLAEQEKASKDQPTASLVGEVGGSALTLPFAALKGLKGAVGLGAASGAGQAISEDKDIKDIAIDTAKGGAIGGAAYGVAKGIEKAAPTIKSGIKSVTDFLDDKSKAVFSKAASTMTGETEKNIRTFIDKNEAVNKLIKESGGDIPAMANKIREGISSDISKFRVKQGELIGKSLDAVSTDKIVSSSSIIEQLEKVKSRINVKLNPEDAGQIDELAKKISSLADESGNISLKELHQAKEFLQEVGQGAYQKAGQIFQTGKVTQQAAKQAAREAKILLDKTVPELKQANDKLFQLHRLEEAINKNLIAPGKSETALLVAGGAPSGQSRIQLDTLGKLIGKDVLGEAEKLSAANAFINPNWLPKSAGGTTSTSRTITAGALGTVFGGPVGGVATAALTSPVTLKKAIQTGIISKKALDAALGFSVDLSEATMEKILPILNNPSNADILSRIITPQLEKSNAVDRRMQSLKNK